MLVEQQQLMSWVSDRGYEISYATPKSSSVALFHLGERTSDHVIFFPTKSKGTAEEEDHRSTKLERA